MNMNQPLPTGSASLHGEGAISFDNVKQSEEKMCTCRKSRDLRAAHPVTTVKTVSTRGGRILVLAGGAHISSAFLHHCLPSCSPSFDRTSKLQQGMRPGNSGEPFAMTICGGPTTRVPIGDSTVAIERGEVTCLAVASLPSSDYAVGIAGTTQGTAVVFLVHGNTVHKTKEIPLSSISKGTIPITDSVRDIVIGMDPAGRPEFVGLATRRAVVLADVQLFLDEAMETKCGFSFQSPSGSSSSSPLPRRVLSDTLVATFTQSPVVRLLCPQRYHASFTMDIALIVVLSSGTIRYIERSVSGGAVGELLEQHHRRWQGSSSMYGYRTAGGGGGVGEDDTNDYLQLPVIPHVSYRYSMSPVALETTTPPSASSSGVQSAGNQRHGGITVNDAALMYNPSTGCMDLVLVGVQHSPSRPALAGVVLGESGLFSSSSMPASPTGAGAASGSAASIRREGMARLPGTLGAVSLAVSSPLPSSSLMMNSGGGITSGLHTNANMDFGRHTKSASSNWMAPQQVGAGSAWWALTERVVLPQGTLYCLSRRWCTHYKGEDHECTIADCVTSLTPHTVSRSERLTTMGAGGIECIGLGLSTVEIVSAAGTIPTPGSSAFDLSPTAAVSLGGDLFLGTFSAVHSANPATSAGDAVTASLPMLRRVGTTGGTAIEAIVIDRPSQVARGADAFGNVAVTAAGSTITLWSF